MAKRSPSKANILWFLPTHGDGRYLGTTTGGREVNFNYLRQIAQAADQLGYFGVLLPTGRSCEDSWVVASAVAPWTERLRYLVAVRPGLQGQGVGRALVAAARDEARARGLGHLELQTRIELIENHAAFARLGFAKVGESAHPGHARPTSITMRAPVQAVAARIG